MKSNIKRRPRKLSLSRPSFYLSLGGLSAILAAVIDTAVRLHRAILHNPNLIGSIYVPAVEYVGASLLVLLGGVLALEYAARA